MSKLARKGCVAWPRISRSSSVRETDAPRPVAALLVPADGGGVLHHEEEEEEERNGGAPRHAWVPAELC